MQIYDNSWINEKQATIIPHHGKAETVAEGKRLFDVPSLLFQSTIGNVPLELCGKDYIFCNAFANMGMRVTKEGWIYVLIEREPEVPTTAHASFYLNYQMGGIFKKLADFDAGELLPGWQEPLSLLGAYCKEGLDFQCAFIKGALTVIFASVDDSYTPVSLEESEKENVELSLKPVHALTGAALQAENEYYRPAERGYMACPTIAALKSGTLFAACMADPFGFTFCGGENYYGYIPVMRSFDGGISWQDPITVFDPDKDGPARVYEPVLWTDECGKTLYLSYSQQAGLENNFAGSVGTWVTYTENPEDDTPVWSEPVRVFSGMADTPPVKCSDGKWYWTGYFSHHFSHAACEEDFRERGTGPRVYVSEDLKNWDYICTLKDGEASTAEPVLTECTEGTLLLIERNNGGSRYATASLSDPSKWTALSPLRYDNTDTESKVMQTVYSRNSLRRLPSGNLLLTFHDNNTKVRDNLSVALSTDGGKSWKHKLLLDERNHSTYAMSAVNSDGEIFILYDQGRVRKERHSGSELLLARLTEEDIIAGKPVTAKAVLKRLVSRYELPPRKDSFIEQMKAIVTALAADYSKKTEIDNVLVSMEKGYTLENYKELCTLCDNALYGKK